MPNPESRKSHPFRPRPLWVLKAVGVWGTGRRSMVRVDDVRIVDLAAPADDGDPTSIEGGSLVSEIAESAEPSTAGLDIIIGLQAIEHLGPGLSAVRDVD